MTITMKTARTLLWTTVVGLSLTLGACDDGKKDDKTAAKDTKDPKGKKGDPKGDPGAKKPGDVKAGDAKAGDAKAGDAKAAEPADEPFDARVVKAAGLAKKIEADPTKADDILAEAGLDRAGFDALIYEVSTPELAEQYRLARARDEG
jgi:hypothetical protein